VIKDEDVIDKDDEGEENDQVTSMGITRWVDK